MKIATTALILLLAFVPILLSAQTNHFHHFNEKDGLSQNTVNALFQDSLGFLWIGTEEGLNRYDGTQFRIFRHLPDNNHSLSNSYINCIFPDKKDHLWVGTSSGLNRYDPVSENFTRIPSPDSTEASNYFHDGLEDEQGYIWCGTYNGLFRLYPETFSWSHFPPDTSLPSGVNHNAVWSVFEDWEGMIWVGTSLGLNILKNDGRFVFERYFHEPEKSDGLISTAVFDIAQTSDGTMWLGTRNGLERASGPVDGLRFSHYQNDPMDINSLSSDFIWEIHPADDGKLFLSTYGGGLNKVEFPHGNLAKPKITHYLHDEKKTNSLAHDEVNCVVPDQSGILWVGTSGGLDKIDPSNDRFLTIQNEVADPKSLRKNQVQAVHFDSRGDLWLGTLGGGLHRLRAADLAAGNFAFEFFQADPNNPNSISHNDIFGISEDTHGYLWIATYDGLNCLKLSDRDEPKFHRFTTDDGVAYKFQYQILQRKNGEHWIATYGRLNRMHFNPDNPKATTFDEYNMDLTRQDALVNASTHTLAEDRFGQLWIGTFNGISKLVSAEGEGVFENYLHRSGAPQSLSNNFVKQLFLDSRGRLWAATRSGLNFMEQTSADAPVVFHHFGLADGLPSEAVQSISEDASGHLWLGTAAGLALFDPEIALENSTEKPVIKHFDFRDGLQGNVFCERTATRGPDGHMYFGGINGLNIFDPGNLWENPFVPPLVFTEFRLFNEVVKPDRGKDSPLQKSITHTHSLTLRHWQNVIGFRFAALSFSQPEKNRFAYRMAGFDKDWVFSGNENSATYTNLSPGKYRFEVKAANSDGRWNEMPIFIDLKILPPPWLTWWAYLIYGLFISGILFGIYRFRLRQKIRAMEENARIQAARFEERENLRKQNAADFHDELGHRLTKIALFLELAERQKNEPSALSNYLAKVRQHATGLSAGIRDLIWTLDPGADSLLQTLVRLREFGDGLFERSGTEFRAEGIDENFEAIKLEPDVRKHLLLIFKEAMNNCLKYSRAAHGLFSVEKTADGFHLELSDDGHGFDLANAKKGYGLRNMQERAEKIGGKLTIQSDENVGTKISLKINMPQMG